MALLAQTMSMAYEMLGRFDALLEQSQKTLSLWESLGNGAGVAEALNGIGVAHHRLGEYGAALEILHRALAKSQNAGSVRAEAYCLASLGDLYRDLAQFDEALTCYGRALERNRVIDATYLRSYTVNARAETLYLAGQAERAQIEIERTLSQGIIYKPHEPHYRIVLAAALLSQQNSDRARVELETVLCQPSLQTEVAFRGHMHLALAAMIENQPQESRDHLHTAIQLAQNAGLTQPLCVESLNHIHVLEFVTEKEGENTELAKWIAAARELERTRKQLAKGRPPSSQSHQPTLRIDALGTSRVFQDGQAVSWRASQAKELFFYLLAHPDGQTKEQIGATLWPDHSPAKLFNIFRSSLFRLRRSLFPTVVSFEGDTYRLNPEVDYQYDASAFQDAFSKAGLADNMVQKAYHYRQALALYKGEFLADLYAEWIMHFREALQARYLQGLAFLAQFNLDNRNYPQAIEHARQILAVEEHHEGAYHVLIKAYARSGQRPSAKQIYDRYKDMLASFDLEPQVGWEDLCR
jgi:two-component SAPR family response regulator